MSWFIRNNGWSTRCDGCGAEAEAKNLGASWEPAARWDIVVAGTANEDKHACAEVACQAALRLGVPQKGNGVD